MDDTQIHLIWFSLYVHSESKSNLCHLFQDPMSGMFSGMMSDPPFWSGIGPDTDTDTDTGYVIAISSVNALFRSLFLSWASCKASRKEKSPALVVNLREKNVRW